MAENFTSGDDDIEQQFGMLMQRARAASRDARFKWEQAQRHSGRTERARRTIMTQQRRNEELRSNQSPGVTNSKQRQLVDVAARMAAAIEVPTSLGFEERERQSSRSATENSDVAVSGGMSPEAIRERARQQQSQNRSESAYATAGPVPSYDPHVDAWGRRAQEIGVSQAAVAAAAAVQDSLAAESAWGRQQGASSEVELLASQYTAENLSLRESAHESAPSASDLIEDAHATTTGMGAGASNEMATSLNPADLSVVADHSEGVEL